MFCPSEGQLASLSKDCFAFLVRDFYIFVLNVKSFSPSEGHCSKIFWQIMGFAEVKLGKTLASRLLL